MSDSMPVMPWSCPECGATAGAHGKGGIDKCLQGHTRMSCQGLLCECDNEGSESHGTSFVDPCHEARCYHCGWSGKLPKKPKGLQPWESKALEAGWVPPAQRGADLGLATGDSVRAMLRALVASLPPDAYDPVPGYDGSIYLDRWTIRDTADGGHVKIHRFARGDHDQELHCHPWHAESMILWGAYSEERRQPNDTVTRRAYHTGDINHIEAATYHRVDLITPEVWTLFVTGPKVSSWSFWDRHTGVVTPWRDFVAAHRDITRPTTPTKP